MKEPQKVFELSEKEEQDLIDICTIVFSELPQIPALINKPQYSKQIIRSLFSLFKDPDKTKSFGIKQDGKIVCAGYCVDSDLNPHFYKKMKFGFVVLKTIGLKGIRQLFMYNKNKPKYDKVCFELMLYGTLPSYQKKGLGRTMLNFLNDYAKKNNYGGVTGVTNTTRPAFQFYMRDGWIVDKEFFIDNYRLCWVRRIV